MRRTPAASSALPTETRTVSAQRAGHPAPSERGDRRLRVEGPALFASDLLALVAAGLLTAAVVERTCPVLWLVLTLPVWALLLTAYGLYRRPIRGTAHSLREELPSLWHTMIVGCLLSGVIANLNGANVAVGSLVLFGVLACALAIVGRTALRPLLIATLGPDRVLLLGDKARTDRVARAMAGRRDVQASTLTEPPDGGPVPQRAGTADCATPTGMLDACRVDHVIVVDGTLERDALLELRLATAARSVRLSLLPQCSDGFARLSDIDDIAGVPVLRLHDGAPDWPARVLKRAVDVVGASLALALLTPFMLLIAVAIRADSPGPAMFRQVRVGRHGRLFVMWKFRTMHVDAELMTAELRALSRDPNWLDLEADPRISRMGRFLRQTSLDELPQLWNVVRGEMSLVGPRPLIPADYARLSSSTRRRHDVAPGLTGLWQVSGRTSVPFEEMVRLDDQYLANWSLRRDIEILLRTIPAVLTQRGAN